LAAGLLCLMWMARCCWVIACCWLLNELREQLRPEALVRLRWHQQRGDRLLLCSASPRLLLQPLVDWLGVELLCTELEQHDGRWIPKLASPNCKGLEKVRRLEQHLGPLEGLSIEAYGDSKGDRELLGRRPPCPTTTAGVPAGRGAVAVELLDHRGVGSSQANAPA
jgi:hypothetical protein